MKIILHYSFHSLVYYLAWLVCILLAAKGYAWTSTACVVSLTVLEYGWQRLFSQNTKYLTLFIFMLTICGSLIDSILTYSGFINFSANPFAPYASAPWMMSLWLNFSVFLFSTCQYFFDKYLLTGGFAFVGFSLAYFVGTKLGAAHFNYSNLSCLMIGLIWMIILPLILYVYQVIKARYSISTDRAR